ncbi:MAG: metallophosphoesterase family protein [Rhizobiaceae bacterium]
MTADGIHYLDARAPHGLRVYVIGDVHGCFGLLRDMHDRIRAEIERDRVEDWRIVHVGDYCDRGPDVRGVVDFLIDISAADDRVIALKGNHDLGFVQFLLEPDANGLFANYGGAQTAASYGVELDLRTPGSLKIAHEALCRAVPRAHRDFLASLPLTAEFGDFFICHAGIRPGVPLDRQRPHDLLWIRSEFLDYPHPHPKLIVHGHTPQTAAEVMANRVNVDTGAVWSGALTALVIDGADKRLLEVRAAS